MGKISPVSIKYIVHADINLSGVVEKPDVIGAVFGQTEGLMGADLELRELQKSGRIGRIDVNIDVSGGKTSGEIILPSSMDKSETVIIAAALETIERIGPCVADIKINKIEDVRISKRNFILSRAKELLKVFVESQPDSQALTNVVTETVRTLEISEYGKDRLPVGPSVEDSEEIIVVEGRADVLNLLKYGIRNVIGVNGTKTSDTIINLINTKVTTLFLDGDRGGDLILKNISSLADVDFVARAPDGKEVEELTLKEINKALRGKEAFEQHKNGVVPKAKVISRVKKEEKQVKPKPRRNILPKKDGELLKQMSEELIGTRGAFILDGNLETLGKVPVKELPETLKNMSEGAYAIVLDGIADKALIQLAEKKKVEYIVSKKAEGYSRSVSLLTPNEL